MSGTIELPAIDVEAEKPQEQFGPPSAAAPKPDPTPRQPKRPSDEIRLKVGGVEFTGWEDVRIIRGMEIMPSHFVVRITERLPDQAKVMAITPGQVFKLFIGDDIVMTGYIDVYDAVVRLNQHAITIVGRSVTEDLVDCAAGVTEGHESESTMTYSASSLLQLAQDLCDPFGIVVTEPDGEGAPIVSVGDGIPQFTIPLGETVFNVIEPIARWKQMIVLDGKEGNLILGKVGSSKAASGFSMPGNCQSAQVAFKKDRRFTVYLPAMSTIDNARDVTAAARGQFRSNLLQPVKDEAAFKDQKRFEGVKPRYRPTFVVSEQFTLDMNLAELRAKWQKARDFGRSQAVNVTVPSWRDEKGALWEPNTLAPVDIPAMKLAKLTWIIAQVDYLAGFGGGRRAVVQLMPKEAFEPEPTFFTPYDPQIEAAQQDALQRRQRASQVRDDNSHSITNPNAGAGGNIRAGESSGA